MIRNSRVVLGLEVILTVPAADLLDDLSTSLNDILAA